VRLPRAQQAAAAVDWWLLPKTCSTPCRAQQLLRLADSGKGVLIMTDIYGATPANIAQTVQPGRIEGVAGVNLPMLLRALTYRDKDMNTLLTRAVSGGRDGVVNMHNH
jgi:PTS system ascorbate-specific IIA component